MIYLTNENIVTIERLNELDRFKSHGYSKKLWVQADVEFLLDETMGKRPVLWNHAIERIGDILISSGEKLKAWSGT